jgi:hypothetical protein
MYKKQNLVALGLLVFMVVLAACSSKKESTTSEALEEDTWESMDKFHMVMAESFHPYKDSANLAPAKANAAAMADAAREWLNAPLPEKVNTARVKAQLLQLKTDTETFVTTVASDDDKAIGESLNVLHDLFHEIQEAWYSDGAEHHHHEH